MLRLQSEASFSDIHGHIKKTQLLLFFFINYLVAYATFAVFYWFVVMEVAIVW